MPVDERQDTNISGPGEILPEPAPENRKRAGGTFTHKPGCRCYPCKARSRGQEAFSEPVGGGEQALVATTEHEASLAPLSATKEEPIRADELVAPPGKGARRPAQAKRAIIAEWIKLRTLESDITNAEAARKIGISRTYLQRVIQVAVQEGWLVFDDPLSRLEYQVIPKAVDNLNAFLDARDKQVTIEVAKGTLFKSFQEAKGIHSGNTTVLALKIELPTADNAQLQVIEGQIVGKPKV